MNELQIFKNPEFGSVRTVDVDGKTYFMANDVAKALGYSDCPKAVRTHCKGVAEIATPTAGGVQNVKFIPEGDIYRLVIKSQLPTAERFERWVFDEVLPTIRKHGMYAEDELLDNPDLLISVAQKLKEERERNKALKAENDRMKPKEIFADAVSASDTSILIGELAKIIKQNGVNIGQNRLFEWMRNNGYLISRKGTDYNMPTQKSMELGLFEIKERTINNPDGSVRITKTVLVTGKGQQYFINKFLFKEEKSA
ncbi:MAG: hypothetical protein HFI70_11165 [Lachnospiraceae bacterium]|nr:hypothetical protein [Lachnospiraceae bacterium]